MRRNDDKAVRCAFSSDLDGRGPFENRDGFFRLSFLVGDEVCVFLAEFLDASVVSGIRRNLNDWKSNPCSGTLKRVEAR